MERIGTPICPGTDDYSEEDLDAIDDFRDANSLWTTWCFYGLNFDDVSDFEPGTIVRAIRGEIYNTQAAIEGDGTWADVWKACDKAIYESGETDHRFIEAFRRLADGSIEIITGS